MNTGSDIAVARLQRKLARSQKRVEILEAMIENKTRDLFTTNEELSDRNEFMHSVLVSMAGALIVADHNKHITIVNDRLCALTGHVGDALLGQHVKSILPEAGTFRVADAHESHEDESHILTSEGIVLPVALTTGRFHNSNGELGFVYIAIDIRERLATREQLQQAQRSLIEVSREAGMAEIASGVLHNVGNVLNSVTVSAAMLSDAVKQSKISSLQRLASLLKANENQLEEFLTQDQKGRQVPEFLGLLTAQLVTEHKNLVNELSKLGDDIDHIKTIIASQQDNAKVRSAIEQLRVEEVFDSALDMFRVPLQRQGIAIATEFAETPVITTDRHKLIQIIVNFVSNAAEAISEHSDSARTIKCFTQVSSTGVTMGVRDSGIGIPIELQNKIFAHGFTTKDTGHGFGLHSCANAASSLGGEIHCHSDGVGTGATFSVSLPLNDGEIINDAQRN